MGKKEKDQQELQLKIEKLELIIQEKDFEI